MNRHVLLTTMVLCAGSCICLAGSVNVTHIADIGVKCNAVDLITIEQHRYVLADTFLINVDNPQRPIAKPGFMFRNVDHVKAAGKHAYVAANLGSLQVLDIGNPDDVKVAGQYKPEGSHLNTGAFCIDVHGKYAYATFAGYGQSEYYGLYILDISDPPKPSKVGHYAAPGWFSDVVVSGDHAYLTIIKSGLHIIDINEPSNPKLVGSCKLPGNAGGVALAGKHCQVTVHDKGLAVVDVSDVTRPTLQQHAIWPVIPRRSRYQATLPSWRRRGEERTFWTLNPYPSRRFWSHIQPEWLAWM